MNAALPHVLVVDDDAVIALDLRQLLRSLGVECTMVESGEQALELVRELQFDLILLNIHLPGISGLEVCRRLKQVPEQKQIPILFLSGETSHQAVAEALRLGAVDYLTKPYEPVHVKARVLACLSQCPSSGDRVNRHLRPSEPAGSVRRQDPLFIDRPRC